MAASLFVLVRLAFGIILFNFNFCSTSESHSDSGRSEVNRTVCAYLTNVATAFPPRFTFKIDISKFFFGYFKATCTERNWPWIGCDPDQWWKTRKTPKTIGWQFRAKLTIVTYEDAECVCHCAFTLCVDKPSKLVHNDHSDWPFSCRQDGQGLESFGKTHSMVSVSPQKNE